MQVTETVDAAAATSTTYSIDVGEYFFGTLDTTLDSDWIRIDLTAGQTYTFGLVGVGALTDNLDDSYLRLRNNAGTQIAFDDDSGPGRNSTITFTATTTGSYYLDVQSWNNFKAGDYGVSVTAGTKASYDVAMGAGVLLRADASWATSSSMPVAVTWGIRKTGPANDGQGDPAAFSQLSAAQIAAAQDVMAMFDGISGLTLTQVNPSGTTDAATLLLGAYTSTTDGAGAYAYYPGSTAFSDNAGDVWVNNDSFSTTSLPLGSFSIFALIHEIGHALGLAHPGDYNAAPGEPVKYATNAQFIEDSHQYTIMSYFDESNTTSSFGSYPDTLLLYDIYALQQLYGADASFHAGNTTYGFNATVGGAYDFTTNTDPVLSIWDGHGIDMLDVSGFSMTQTIDLRSGFFSDIGGLFGNVSIAIGAQIEKASGGSGSDTIFGNVANNVLLGNNGDDWLEGRHGDDTIRAGLGDDVLQGAAGADRLFAAGGRDTLNGGTGHDEMFGENGDDNLNGGSNRDTLKGGAGFDTLKGGVGADILFGGDHNDRLFGGSGADTLQGDAGNDLLVGNLGNDVFVFADSFGTDTIRGFEALKDLEKIDLSAVSGISSFADLTNPDLPHMAQVGAHVVIDDFSGNTITLLNVSLDDLSASDFIF